MRPTQLQFYMPAEWHPHTACWMGWPSRVETWKTIGLPRAQAAYAQVANAIAAYEPVNLLVRPEDRTQAQQLCHAGVHLIELPLDDSWLRDTGPTFLLNPQGGFAGVDWIHNAWGKTYANHALDDQIATAIIQRTQAHHFHAPLVMEGGAFHVDGEGTLLTTRQCLLHPNRNPNLSQSDIERYLCDYLGVKKIIWLNQGLEGDETDGHVDEIACFIAPGHVLALITHDKDDVNYERLQENLDVLKSSIDAQGRTLEVHTVEQPPATFLEGERLTLSYVNFYRANGAVIMPSFGHLAHDEAALNQFKQLFPESVVCQIDALDVFAGGGGIHCITQQQPQVLVAQD